MAKQSRKQKKNAAREAARVREEKKLQQSQERYQEAARQRATQPPTATTRAPIYPDNGSLGSRPSVAVHLESGSVEYRRGNIVSSVSWAPVGASPFIRRVMENIKDATSFLKPVIDALARHGVEAVIVAEEMTPFHSLQWHVEYDAKFQWGDDESQDRERSLEELKRINDEFAAACKQLDAAVDREEATP